MEERKLLTLTLESLDRAEESARHTREQVDRLASISANLIMLLKRADAQSANGRLQQQAAMNEILRELSWLKGTVLTPEGLAGVASRSVIDQARQIKRTNEIALTGKDPMKSRRRDDEVTLVSIPLGHGKKWRPRANKTLVKAVCTIIGVMAGMLAHRYGLPWAW